MIRLKFLLAILCTELLVCACAPSKNHDLADPWQGLRQADGAVVWHGEYRFMPPPAPWRALVINESGSSLAFFKTCDPMTTQTFPCESTIAYAEEPFGHSRDLTSRAHQFLRRYLWAARVNFAEPEIASTSVNGRTSLVIKVSGREPVKHYRVLCKILFMHRGERAVAFFSNQWRNGDVPFSTEDFGDFDRFVESFQFIKPSFYEDLEDHQQ